MSRDKQIEEMARIIANANGNEQDVAYYIPDATDLYNAGYRKASDLAEEIFAEIEAIIRKHDERPKYQLMLDLAELKKKYTEVAERREVSENNTVRCFHPSVTESQREAERREDIEKSPVDCSTPSVTDSKGDTE